jgi:thioredoxin-like negative regulator of GroEL
MNPITQAIEKAEAFLVLGIGVEAWETLEDLPTEAKNIPRVLELRLESLVCMKNWPMAEILGESLAAIMPDSVSVWLSLARIRAQLGRREAALEAIGRVTALDASKRLEMVDDELLAGVW